MLMSVIVSVYGVWCVYPEGATALVELLGFLKLEIEPACGGGVYDRSWDGVGEEVLWNAGF
jgi:hypothetical protein